MTTARDLITQALKEATVLGVGQTPLAEDTNDAFYKLGTMIAAWQEARWMVPALIDVSMPGNGQRSNTIGIGGYWNMTRPVGVKGGYVVQLNTGLSPVSLPLRQIFSYEEYIRIAIKSLVSLPDHFFYDGSWPMGNLFFYPIPTSTYETHILIEKQLNFPIAAQSPPVAGTGLDTVFTLPPSYEEAILYNLAIRLISSYQVRNPSPQTGVLAKIALNRIKKSNTQIPTMVMPVHLRPRGSFNIYNPDGYGAG